MSTPHTDADKVSLKKALKQVLKQARANQAKAAEAVKAAQSALDEARLKLSEANAFARSSQAAFDQTLPKARITMRSRVGLVVVVEKRTTHTAVTRDIGGDHTTTWRADRRGVFQVSPRRLDSWAWARLEFEPPADQAGE